MLKQLSLEPHIIIDTDDGSELIFMMENNDPEQRNILLSYMIENNCILKRIVWVSKYDREEISGIEPKVFDAYNCVLHIIGDRNKIINALYLYNNRDKDVRFLESCLDDSSSCINLEAKKDNSLYITNNKKMFKILITK